MGLLVISNLIKMRKAIIIFGALIAFCSCSDNLEADLECYSERSDSKTETGVDVTPKHDSVYYIKTVGDLNTLVNSFSEKRRSMKLSEGWEEVCENKTESFIRRKSPVRYRIDTAYVNTFSVDDNIDPSNVRFKTMFSKTVTDKINEGIGISYYKVSPGVVYECEWELYIHNYQTLSGEKLFTRPSPRCGLHPNTKKGFTERGYLLYKKDNYYSLESYQIRILWQYVHHNTTILAIEYPFFVNEGKQRYGLEYIYGVIM